MFGAYVSPQQRAESGERFQRARGGPGDGLGRSSGTCALVAVAGRRKEELFFFAVSTRTARCRWSSLLLLGSGSMALEREFGRGWAAL